MDYISATRLSFVAPALADKIKQMITMLETAGFECRVTQALRSWSQQDTLYAIGRDEEGNETGKIVTNCKGGYSYHNFGLAADVVPSLYAPWQPYNPDWNLAHESWKRMIEIGQSLGLESGAQWRTFPDAPHFQLNGKFPVSEPGDEVRQLFKDGGMQAVWDEITKV